MELFTNILEITIFSSIMILIVLSIKAIFGNKINAKTVSFLWALVLIRLIMPITFESPVHMDSIIPVKPVEVVEEQSPEAAKAEKGFSANNTYNNNFDYGDAQITPSDTKTDTIANSQTEPTSTIFAQFIDYIKSISIWTVLFAAWAIGAVVTMLTSTLKMIFFCGKAKRCALADNSLKQMLEQHKKTICVQRQVSIIECEYVDMPVTYGLFVPKILLPAGLANSIGHEKMSLIIMHELCHIKRLDVLKNYAWLVAKIIHWFNPLVYLAFKTYIDDVELACDELVLKNISEAGKFVYSQSLLDVIKISNKGRKAPVVLSFCENKSKLRERVETMVKPKTKSRSAGFAAMLLAIIMIMACFTTACQPTPEEPVVYQKTEVYQESEAAAKTEEDAPEDVKTAAPVDFKPIEVPEHISEVYDDYPYLSITYDADVVVPETTAYPVTEVSKRVFSEEDFLSYIDLLTDGNYEMYSEWTLTKDDYLVKMTKAKEYEGTERVIQDNLNYLQERFDEATNAVVNPRITNLSELPSDSWVNLFIKNEANTISRFGFERNGNYFSYTRDEAVIQRPASLTADSQYVKNMDGSFEHYQWQQPCEPDISQEDAYAIALEYKDIFGNDLDLYYAETCSFIKDYVDKTTGWQFTFTRSISNLQTIQETGGYSVDPNHAPSYASPWGEETLTITVDKDGVFSMGWQGASEIGSTVIESAQHMDFDLIQERITNQLNYICASWGENQNKVLQIKITKIQLGISMMSVKDEPDIGEYIPTWYVSYSCKFEGEDEELQQIMFSAIDGSYIEPRITNEKLMQMIDPQG